MAIYKWVDYEKKIEINDPVLISTTRYLITGITEQFVYLAAENLDRIQPGLKPRASISMDKFKAERMFSKKANHWTYYKKNKPT